MKKKLARSASISFLQGLSSRPHIALARAGIKTVGELDDLHFDDLMAIPNIGTTLAYKIRAELAKFDIVQVEYIVAELDTPEADKLHRRIDHLHTLLEKSQKEIAALKKTQLNHRGEINKLVGNATLSGLHELMEGRDDAGPGLGKVDIVYAKLADEGKSVAEKELRQIKIALYALIVKLGPIDP